MQLKNSRNSPAFSGTICVIRGKKNIPVTGMPSYNFVPILSGLLLTYFTSTESFRSVSTKIRPQFSQTITFLRSLISLCFCGGMA